MVQCLVYPEVKDKAKYKPMNTGFCNYVFCNKTVQLTDDGKCTRCFSPVARKETTYKATLEKFEKILEQNKFALNNHIFTDIEMNSFKIPIQIGKGNNDQYYFVALRYLVEYQNYKHSDDYHDNKKSIIDFIEHIMMVSPKVRL